MEVQEVLLSREGEGGWYRTWLPVHELRQSESCLAQHCNCDAIANAHAVLLAVNQYCFNIYTSYMADHLPACSGFVPTMCVVVDLVVPVYM